ncbi:GntR family transcriptional regulator [Muricoccus aerilatus]|uniref:GntR family transcriptional regulator n=1 Tax=Muricoccus aerilatus TaxID=452982 RepID=UPI0005C130F1|nr:GntR family transcriptional regulator [Roseomonas aerilata]
MNTANQTAKVLDFVAPVGRENLAGRVYEELRTALFEGRMRPGQRLKIRDLAAAMGVSETPVREAVVQLARERALRLEAARSITVAGLSLEQYLELRTIRLELEGLAAEAASLRAAPHEVEALERAHATLVAAEDGAEPLAANRANWAFHHTLYAAAAMPELLSIIESIWLRNGPMHAFLYPDARPSYPGRHRHLDIIEGLRARDPHATREALRADLTEGGANLVALLGRMERDAAWAAPA